MTQPNFFIVGAAKSGTTSLCRYLAAHPDVYISPIKEPCFFAPEVAEYTPRARREFLADAQALAAYLDGPMRDMRRGGIVVDWDQYLKLFKHVNGESAVGEGSVSYLTSSTAPAAIRARLPNARIIAILRDPADRLFSQYSESYASGDTQAGFMDWIDEHAALESARNPPFGPIWTGRYAPQLARYFECFPRDRIRVYLYDDYVRNSAELLADAFHFLGVDGSIAIDTTEKHNVTRIPRWASGHRRVVRPLGRVVKKLLPRTGTEKASAWWYGRRIPPPTPAERARVIRMYDTDIRELERLLSRDLSPWFDHPLELRGALRAAASDA